MYLFIDRDFSLSWKVTTPYLNRSLTLILEELLTEHFFIVILILLLSLHILGSYAKSSCTLLNERLWTTKDNNFCLFRRFIRSSDFIQRCYLEVKRFASGLVFDEIAFSLLHCETLFSFRCWYFFNHTFDLFKFFFFLFDSSELCDREAAYIAQ